MAVSILFDIKQITHRPTPGAPSTRWAHVRGHVLVNCMQQVQGILLLIDEGLDHECEVDRVLLRLGPIRLLLIWLESCVKSLSGSGSDSRRVAREVSICLALTADDSS